ncbi:MAG: LptF/LptG family permease [Thermoguttaceae bacterium]
MTIFDRYVLRSFLKTLILWFFCFIGIYIVFDLFSNLDSFLKTEGGMIGSISLIARYYTIQSLPFFDKTAPLLCLTSATITLAMMMRHNELVAILAAGISQVRVVKPIIYAVLIISISLVCVRELVLPRFLDDLQKVPSQYTEHTGSDISSATDTNSFLSLQGEKAFLSENRIVAPHFAFLSKQLTEHGKYLQAQEAVYQPADVNHPNGYLMVNVQKPKEILNEPSLCVDDKTVIITPKDANWLAPTDCFVVSNVPLAYIAANRSWRDYASTWEYIRALRDRSLDLGDDVEMKIHARIVQPFLDMVLLLLGIPIILSKGDRNVFKAMGLVALLVFTFLVVQYGALFVGKSMEAPILGVWFPLLLFVPLVVNLYRTMQEN